jgi:hypothetical protein
MIRFVDFGFATYRYGLRYNHGTLLRFPVCGSASQ